MTWNEDWAQSTPCQTGDLDALFVRGAAQHDAKRICEGCPVKTECLAEALDQQIEWGVWGGMTERERRLILRRNPDVKSWRMFFMRARSNFEKGVRAVTTAAPLPTATATVAGSVSRLPGERTACATPATTAEKAAPGAPVALGLPKVRSAA